MWQGIQGHDAVVERFRQTLAAHRLASTYLFVGPEGVGKRAFALKLAQTLLCAVHDPAEMNPCGSCESCRLATASSHPDLDVVGALAGTRHLALAQFIGKRDSRNQEGLCHNLALRPSLGQRRVAIIDDADWFTMESANCLLKVLEEPPPGAVIILIGTSRSRQLPTILSRSQVIRFAPLSHEVIRALVLAQGLANDGDAANQIASRAEGSLSRARDRSDGAAWQVRNRFVAELTSGELDAPRLIRDVEEFINSAGKEADARRQRFRLLLALVNEHFSQSLRNENAATPTEVSLAVLDRSLAAEEQLDRNANQSTLLESWVDDLASLLESPTATPAS